MTVIGRDPARWNVPHPLSTGTLISVVPAVAYDDAVAEAVALTEQLQGAVEALRFYAAQYGVGARLASDGGNLARQTLRAMGVEPPRAEGQ